jgi:hypothetical protein
MTVQRQYTLIQNPFVCMLKYDVQAHIECSVHMRTGQTQSAQPSTKWMTVEQVT